MEGWEGRQEALKEAEALIRGFVYDEYGHDLTIDATAWLARLRQLETPAGSPLSGSQVPGQREALPDSDPLNAPHCVAARIIHAYFCGCPAGNPDCPLGSEPLDVGIDIVAALSRPEAPGQRSSE